VETNQLLIVIQMLCICGKRRHANAHTADIGQACTINQCVKCCSVAVADATVQFLTLLHLIDFLLILGYCRMLQCVAVCCSVLQYVAMCCRVLQCTTRLFDSSCYCTLFTLLWFSSLVYCSMLQCVAVYCSVLQCIAVCCSVLQCAVVADAASQSTAEWIQGEGSLKKCFDSFCQREFSCFLSFDWRKVNYITIQIRPDFQKSSEHMHRCHPMAG